MVNTNVKFKKGSGYIYTMSNKITFESSEDEVLRNIISEGIDKEIVLEADKQPKAVKVFKTIGGLTNLGRTFFWNQNELNEKRKWVEAQMVQKYGAEIYGISAQLRGQADDKTSSAPASGGLI